MSKPRDNSTRLTPELLLRAYAIGVFPMAERRDDEGVFWVSPKRRGIIPLDGFHVSSRLARTVRRNVFDVRCDTDFRAVVEGCAESTERRQDTWINGKIFQAYSELHDLGYAHSVECWIGDSLVGGLYGVALGGAFFGESMFSRRQDASKVALVHLVARLRYSGYVLLDTQFVTDHLLQFGAIEVPAEEYLRMLDNAIQVPAQFYRAPLSRESGEELDILLRQSRTQTS